MDAFHKYLNKGFSCRCHICHNTKQKKAHIYRYTYEVPNTFIFVMSIFEKNTHNGEVKKCNPWYSRQIRVGYFFRVKLRL